MVLMCLLWSFKRHRMTSSGGEKFHKYKTDTVAQWGIAPTMFDLIFQLQCLYPEIKRFLVAHTNTLSKVFTSDNSSKVLGGLEWERLSLIEMVNYSTEDFFRASCLWMVGEKTSWFKRFNWKKETKLNICLVRGRRLLSAHPIVKTKNILLADSTHPKHFFVTFLRRMLHTLHCHIQRWMENKSLRLTHMAAFILSHS